MSSTHGDALPSVPMARCAYIFFTFYVTGTNALWSRALLHSQEFIASRSAVARWRKQSLLHCQRRWRIRQATIRQQLDHRGRQQIETREEEPNSAESILGSDAADTFLAGIHQVLADGERQSINLSQNDDLQEEHTIQVRVRTCEHKMFMISSWIPRFAVLPLRHR